MNEENKANPESKQLKLMCKTSRITFGKEDGLNALTCVSLFQLYKTKQDWSKLVNKISLIVKINFLDYP